jgi:hypothetical protein
MSRSQKRRASLDRMRLVNLQAIDHGACVVNDRTLADPG